MDTKLSGFVSFGAEIYIKIRRKKEKNEGETFWVFRLLCELRLLGHVSSRDRTQEGLNLKLLSSEERGSLRKIKFFWVEFGKGY